MSHSNQSTPTRSKLSLRDRILRLKSMITTSRLAVEHLHDHDGTTEYSDISETLEHVEELLDACAEEMENLPFAVA